MIKFVNRKWKGTRKKRRRKKGYFLCFRPSRG